MTNDNFIKKLKELKQVKPDENWVFLTKAEILNQEQAQQIQRAKLSPGAKLTILANELSSFAKSLIFRPAFATISAIGLFFLLGTFGFAQNSLPGDLLYPVKKITERINPKPQLELTEQRLKELSKITEANQVKNLAFALEEYETSKIKAGQEVVISIKESKTEQEAVIIAKKAALQLKAINDKEKEVLATLGIELEKEDQESENTEKIIVELLIKDLNSQTLTEDQQEILEQAEELMENQEYQEALVKILLLSYPQAE